MPDLTVAISRKATTRVVAALTNLAAGTATATAIPLNENVTVDIRAAWHIPATYLISFDTNPDAIRLNELDLVFDRLDLTFHINAPTITVGGNCVLRSPLGRCLQRLPVVTLFGAANDFDIPVVLDGVRGEVSGELWLKLVHFTAADADALSAAARAHRNDLVTNLAQQLAPTAPAELVDFFRMAMDDGWELRVEPHWADIDPIDVPDQVADSLNTQLTNGVNTFGAGLTASTRTALTAVVGDFSNFIRDLLDLPDDLTEFLKDLLTSVGLVHKVQEALSNEFGFLYLIKIPDQAKFDIHPSIPPVSIRITNAELEIEPEELSITVDIDSADN